MIAFLIFLTVFMHGMDIKNIIGVSEKWEDATEENCKGFYWQIAKEVFALSDIALECKLVPYARSVHMVEIEKADFWVASYENEVDFAVYPKYYFDADNVAALYDKTKIKIDSIKDLSDKNIIWMRGYGYDEYLNTKIDFKEIDSREGGIKMVQASRADIMLDAKVELENTLHTLKNTNNLEIKIVHYLPLYMGFKNNKRGKELAKIWDENLLKLHQSGKLQKLYKEADYTKIYPFKN